MTAWRTAVSKSSPGRMQTVHGHPKGARVVVDYAHTPDALAAALGALRPEATGKALRAIWVGVSVTRANAK